MEIKATADLVDDHGPALQVCDLPFLDLGGRPLFGGRVRTVTCFQDNALLRAVLAGDGAGQVLVVDGQGSRGCALMGDMIAAAAVEHGWSGVIVNGMVRDRVALATLDLGVKALGSTPRKSAKAGLGAVDVAVGFGGVIFRPGDELVADPDGIVLLAH